MSIVKMKKVFLAGPLERLEETVAQLEELGVLHVVHLASEIKEPSADLIQEKARLKRIIDQLESLASKHDEIKSKSKKSSSIDKLLDIYDKLTSEKYVADQKIALLEKEKLILNPWGDFSFKDVEYLNENSIFVNFFAYSKKEEKELDKEFLKSAIWHRNVDLKGAKSIGLITVSLEDLSLNSPVDTISLPKKSISEIDKNIESLNKRIDDINSKLLGLYRYLEVFEKSYREVSSKIEKQRVMGGILEDGPIFALSGYAPAKKVHKIEKHFSSLPVATIFEDPEYGEDVPIKLHNWRLVSYFEPLIGMFQLPTYWEPDPTLLVAPFMGLFFAFCFGDAAYGLILFIMGTLLGIKLKNNEMGLKFMRMLQVLGILTFIFGALMGSFMGVQFTNFSWADSIKQFMPLAYFTKSRGYNDFLIFSIKLGIFQLAFGQLVQLFLYIKRGMIQGILSTIGWLGMSVMFYQLIFVYWPNVGNRNFLTLLISSATLIVLFSAPSKNPAKRIGGGLWSLYNVTGLGGDIVSYARIFGLGLSSGILAATFNSLAFGVGGSLPPYIAWLPVSLILIFGHTFNIAMAAIGSLVHSARLNFLEYYGKFYVGGGKPYLPFGIKRNI